MSVFISWSENDSLSHDVARLLKEWLPLVIQKLQCFLSSQDIAKGGNWIQELFDHLDRSNIGIVCLTRSNLTKPWINFEAGAIAKKFGSAHVCPLLLDLEASEVSYPVAVFQSTKPDKLDMRKLLDTINEATPDPLTKYALDDAFEMRWPKFDSELKSIRSNIQISPVKAPRPDHEILEELLSLTRGIAFGRIRGATVPVSALTSVKPLWDYLVNTVRKRRPLIVAWVEKAITCEISNDCFIVYYSEEEQLAMQSLLRPNNFKLLQTALSEFCTLRLEIRLLDL